MEWWHYCKPAENQPLTSKQSSFDDTFVKRPNLKPNKHIPGKEMNCCKELDALIEAGKKSPHRQLTNQVLSEIWQRGSKINSYY
jgi:hypothetical protein